MPEMPCRILVWPCVRLHLQVTEAAEVSVFSLCVQILLAHAHFSLLSWT